MTCERKIVFCASLGLKLGSIIGTELRTELERKCEKIGSWRGTCIET